MEWARTFYQQQYELLGRSEAWPKVWARTKASNPPPRVQLIKRLIGLGPKRILELGCGSGIISGALAVAGHTVVAVDSAPLAANHARQIASSLPHGQMEVFEGDFFDFTSPGLFDVVCYFDGFGIGSDEDQHRLLRRITGWLASSGSALVDIYNPYYFARHDGVEYEETEQVQGQTDFDPETSRLYNKIWLKGHVEKGITQTLRCYSPADFRVLLEGTGLGLDQLEPYASGHHAQRVSLKEAPLYLTKLVVDLPA